MNQVLIFSTVPISIFGTLKAALRGRRFADDDELKHIASEELRRFSEEFYAIGTQRLMSSWKKCVDNEEELVEK
jgi:hypothetical protein